MPSLTNPAAPLSPANGGRGRFQDAQGPAPRILVACEFSAIVRDAFRARGFDADLFSAPIKHTALENPVSIISSRFRKPDQIIQPWQFGHGETKATCLWLNNLPKLKPTNIVEGREARVHRMPPGPDRWKERSRTFTGIAEAMADQWGEFLLQSLNNIRSDDPEPLGAASPAVSNLLHG